MKISVGFREIAQGFRATFEESKQSFVANFGEVSNIGTGTPYTGSYEVTPSVEEQRLETAQKIMREDIIINPIPYFEVSNNSGGTTVTIGN